MAQVFNFSSGPAMLPVDVLKQAQQDLCDWQGLGTSVMEISHRGKEFIQVAAEHSLELQSIVLPWWWARAVCGYPVKPAG